MTNHFFGTRLHENGKGASEALFELTRRPVALLLCLLVAVLAALPCPAENADAKTTAHPRLLYLSAYAYDWDSVPEQLAGVAGVLGTKAKIDYLFMDTKKRSYEEAKTDIEAQISKNLAAYGPYDGVLLEDDAALDFALETRDSLFAGVPMVFMGINTVEKAERAHEDPLITGMVECFPYDETVALAEQLYPNATTIVGISDNSESGRGCTQRFYEAAAAHPELSFRDLNTSTLSEQEIADAVASYDDTTILMFLSLVEDKNGNLYSLLEATEFVSTNAKIPLFKADSLGVGEGVFGGYVSSYKEMAATAAQQMLQILTGTDPAAIPVKTMGGYPLFDQNEMNRFGIQKSRLPAQAVILNYVPTFYERYRIIIWPGVALIFFLLMVAVFLLLYARKQAELRMAALKSEAQDAYLRLEAKKTHELSTALLRAKKADRAKSDFLARMSHEIRTPMNAVIGETTLAQHALEHTESRDKVAGYLRQIQISSRHLLNIINDILDMSAIESNKIKLSHVDFDLKEVISTVTTLYYAQCETKGIDFQVKAKNVLTEFLVGDQLRLQQVVLNLLSNAFKFTPAGGQITFFAEETQDGQPEGKLLLRLSVKDTGTGMSEEYMSRIFKPFEQESSLTAKEHGGSGLGLSICKNLVELMGGQIHVASKLGEGSCFTLEIPFDIAANQLRSLQGVENMKVMLIDDDAETLEYTSGILNHIGIEHSCETDPSAALETLVKARNDGVPYTLCLVDWRMRAMDGLEVTRRIRQALAEDTVVIVLTAYDVAELSDTAAEAGADSCITKPVFQSSLFELMMSLSEGKLMRRTVEPKDYDFSGKCVLLADDTEINREIAQELLAMVGFTVEEATNGAEAVERFRNAAPGHYDVILMDIQMPVMNGYEATRAIRALDRPDAKTVPILAMTANAFVEDIALSLSAGMNDHISKPIDTALLYSLLARYLSDPPGPTA